MSEYLDKRAADQKQLADNDDGETDKGEGYPDIWKPEEGKQLMGVVKKVMWPFVPTADENRWLLEIEDTEGKAWTVWCSNAVLKGLLIEIMPAIDAEIVITVGGTGKTKAGYNYRKFQMAAQPSDPELYLDIMKETKAKAAVREAMHGADMGGGGTPSGAIPNDTDPF